RASRPRRSKRSSTASPTASRPSGTDGDKTMPDTKTLTFVLMDAPFESARTTTAMRLLDIAARRGYRLNVFAYEGAVALTFARQAAHANAAHGRDVHEENHPLPRDWVSALMEIAM